VCLAARVCGTPLDISLASIESDDDFLARIPDYERIRVCSPDIPAEYYRAAAGHDKYIATAPPVSEGRVELLHYIKEQSIAHEYHRYGSITEVPAEE
jgi:RHH-type proline utilization regulon transcriptional repressor/proline dehydrogenase/delta 1-pyrroline-5-carboxylate dehydrogenase